MPTVVLAVLVPAAWLVPESAAADWPFWNAADSGIRPVVLEAPPADPPTDPTERTFGEALRHALASSFDDALAAGDDELPIPVDLALLRGQNMEADDLWLVAGRRGGFLAGGRLRAEYLDDFSERNRVGGILTLESRLGVGIDTEWHYWRERRGPGARQGFWTGDANVVYVFGQGKPVRFQSGVGVNWLTDRGRTDYGWNTTYGLDVQITQMWVLSGALDWGKLGSRTLWHGRVTAGLLLGRIELFGGYDHFDLGKQARRGPIAGLGLWF